jgi:hypothetical protein
MPASRIDALPMDVIRHVLYPYLDYHGRVGINALLQPYERIGTSLRRQAILQVQFALSAADVRSGLKTHDNLHGTERHEHMYKFMSTVVRKNLCMTQHNASYRRTVLAKLAHFGDPTLPDYTHCTMDLCRRMTAVCLDMIIDINTQYPYLYDLTLPNQTTGWTSVDAGPHVETDNELYLVEQRKHEYETYKAKCAQILAKRQEAAAKRHAKRQEAAAKRQEAAAKRQATMAKRMPAIEKGQAALFNRVLSPAINSIQLNPQPHNYWLRSQKNRA